MTVVVVGLVILLGVAIAFALAYRRLWIEADDELRALKGLAPAMARNVH